MLRVYAIASLLFLSLFVQAFSQDSLKQGFTRFYYGNGQISSEGVMREGKPDGKWITYHVNGEIKSVGLRRNFQLDSVWNFFDDNGVIREQITYRYGQRNGYYIKYQQHNQENNGPPKLLSKELYLDNKKQGLSYYYDQNGDIQRIIRFKNGKKHGLMRELNVDSLIITVYRYHNDFMIDREFINQRDNNGVKQGVWRDYYDNDQVKYEANYNNGELNGYYREYASTGRVLVSQFYENGQLIEREREEEIQVEMITQYDSSGQIVSSGGFLNNIPVGTHQEFDRENNKVSIKEYNNSGQVVSSGSSSPEGLKEEFWQFFYPGGMLRSEGSFRSDQRNGEWKFYFPDGQLEQSGNYLNGREDGLWTWYFRSGTLRREENYYRGLEDGSSIEYNENGDIVSQGEYIEGQKEGEWFYHVGDHTEKGQYQQGLKNGMWRHYFTNDVKSFEGNYVQGMENGKHRWYHENGKLKEERHYTMGIKDRTWFTFDQEGNVVISYTYENDVLIKINGAKVNIEND